MAGRRVKIEKQYLPLKGVVTGVILLVVALALVFLVLYAWGLHEKSKPKNILSREEVSKEKINLLYNQGKAKEVIPLLQVYLKKNRNDIQAQNMLASAYLLVGDIKRATRRYQLILKLKPGDSDTLYRLGILYREQGLPGEAIVYLKKAIEVAPAVPLYQAELARALTATKKFDEALSVWEKVMVLTPPSDKKYRATIYGEMANIYLLKNNWQMAQDMLESGLRIDAQNQFLLTLKEKITLMQPRSSRPAGRD
jgi:tetratricopeptide (TPR) repeat protein